MARRASGISLTGLLIIGGALYFTGAGAWLWERTKQLDGACFQTLQQLGTGYGTPVCEGLSRLLHRAENGAAQLGSSLTSAVRSSGQRAGTDLGRFADQLLQTIGGPGSSLSGITSSGRQLQRMMQEQPALLSAGSSAKQRLRTAMDQFVIGQHHLRSQAPQDGMRWLNQSASQPGGYGVLSQLQLGDMYQQGSFGISKNPQAAQYYYQQAKQSVQTLRLDPSREAQMLLQNVPNLSSLR